MSTHLNHLDAKFESDIFKDRTPRNEPQSGFAPITQTGEYMKTMKEQILDLFEKTTTSMMPTAK